MNFQEFDKFQEKLLAEVVGMRNTKGKEYAIENDRFANFNEDAQINGVDRLICANIFLNKHLRSIRSYIRNKQTYSNESIRGRFVDAIVYLTLIAGMIEETESSLKDKPIDDKSPLRRNASPFPPTLTDKNEGKHQPMEYDPSQSPPLNCTRTDKHSHRD